MIQHLSMIDAKKNLFAAKGVILEYNHTHMILSQRNWYYNKH